MTVIAFEKYHGTGNDFIMIDNRSRVFRSDNIDLITKMCHRRFGIGADGLILIEPSPECDFEMVYFNSDGSQSFCGNGSRCAVKFAFDCGIIGKECRFKAIDGTHAGTVHADDTVSISIRDVDVNSEYTDHQFIHTGSPHYIRYVDDLKTFPVVAEAKKIRYNDTYREKGTNVNFVQDLGNRIHVRTYERGVEDETLSCGSGVTACALSYAKRKSLSGPVNILSEGGELNVKFLREGDTFKNIELTGPAVRVFRGEYYA